MIKNKITEPRDSTRLSQYKTPSDLSAVGAKNSSEWLEQLNTGL